MFNSYHEPLPHRIISAPQLIRIKALPAAQRIVYGCGYAVGVIAFSFFVVHRRRIQHGHVALGTIS